MRTTSNTNKVYTNTVNKEDSMKRNKKESVGKHPVLTGVKTMVKLKIVGFDRVLPWF